MKRTRTIIAQTMTLMVIAQSKSDMLIRISELEVYPEHLTEYLNFANNVL